MLESLSNWLPTTGVGRLVADVLWVIPTLQIFHILAMGLLLTSAVFMNLRLLEVIGRDRSVTWFADRFLPWIWAPLAVLVLSGILLVTGEPARSLFNPVFQTKMLLLALVVILTVAFQQVVRRNLGRWDAEPSAAARLVGAGSLILWVAIVVAGRLIAYVE